MSHTNHRAHLPAYDAVIIGAGLAGLTAAARLATTGHSVVVLERNNQIGGRARTDDLDGWLFDHGAHALYRHGIGHETLEHLGVQPDGATPPLRHSQLSLSGSATPLPVGPASLAVTRALAGRSKVQFARFLASLSRLEPAAHAHLTVNEWLAPLRPDVQETIKAVVRLTSYSADTDIMSADAAITQLVIGQKGVLYLHGGWATLCDQLAARATEHGARIKSSSTVNAVTTDAGFNTVTTPDDQLTAANVIVAAGGPQLTASLLGTDAGLFGPVGPPTQAAVLDLALGSMPQNHRFIIGLDEPTYFSVQSPPARSAPAGKAAAVAMRYLAHGDDGSAQSHRESLEAIAALAGADAPVRSRFLRRMTVTNATPTAATGGLAGRPAVHASERPGVLIAGDWVGPRGLLADAAIASGDEAARAVEDAVRRSRSATLV